MQLTTQSTETFVRRFAAASNPELQKCAKELKAIAGDAEQAPRVSMMAREIAAVLRRQIKIFS